MIEEALSAPSGVPFVSSYTLSKNVSAIPILSDGEELSRIGLITHLPGGAEIDVRGPGFNERTVKIRSGGAFYFIFLEDLEPQRKRAARAVAG